MPVLILIILLLLSGCVPAVTPHPETLLEGEVLLQADSEWQGDILVDGQVTVAFGTTLRIAPGTRIRFVRRDADRDGLGDATIVVKGSLIAIGTEDQPIRFLSAETEPAPGDWLEIRSDFARELLFDWCEFRDSAYTLHAHFTRGHLRNSHIHHNIDGSRLGRSRFLVAHNLIEQNDGKGINFRDSEVQLRDNIIRDNRAGVFLFEKPGKSQIAHNNIYHNGLNLQLGDFFSEDVQLNGNWWGSNDAMEIAASIYDREDDSELGRAILQPANAWLTAAGIRRSAQFEPLWQFETEGYVDAAALAVADKIVAASWDGALRAFSTDGELLWRADSGDVVDGGLLALDGRIFAQNWNRQLVRIDPAGGTLEKVFEYPASPADDHRQGGLAETDELLLLPAWNGRLYAFDRTEMSLRWQLDAGLPLRASPLVAHGQIYQGAGDGTLSVVDFDGELRWRQKLGAPLLSRPVPVGDSVLLLDKAGTLYRYSAAGELLWRRELSQACFYAAPLVRDNDIFVATAAGELWKIAADDGRPVWSRPLAGPTYATPQVVEHGLLVGDNTGVLQLLDRDSGRRLAQWQVDGAIQAQVLVTGNRLYFGSRDRKLHALSLIWGGAQ